MVTPCMNLTRPHTVFGSRFYFELDDVPSASEMTSTELRIFKRPSEHDYQNYFITVFRIDEDRMGEDK